MRESVARVGFGCRARAIVQRRRVRGLVMQLPQKRGRVYRARTGFSSCARGREDGSNASDVSARLVAKTQAEDNASVVACVFATGPDDAGCHVSTRSVRSVLTPVFPPECLPHSFLHLLGC